MVKEDQDLINNLLSNKGVYRKAMAALVLIDMYTFSAFFWTPNKLRQFIFHLSLQKFMVSETTKSLVNTLGLKRAQLKEHFTAM